MSHLGRKLGGKTKNWVAEDHLLGMSIGTASNRLRKQLMFEAVKSLRQNFCYRCGAEIATAEELTVDHKQEWRGRKFRVVLGLEQLRVIASFL